MNTVRPVSRRARATRPLVVPDPPQAPEGEETVAIAACVVVSPEQHRTMIAEAAYFLAAARGFCPGQELDDWLAAEAHVNARLGVDQLGCG